MNRDSKSRNIFKYLTFFINNLTSLETDEKTISLYIKLLPKNNINSLREGTATKISDDKNTSTYVVRYLTHEAVYNEKCFLLCFLDNIFCKYVIVFFFTVIELYMYV